MASYKTFADIVTAGLKLGGNPGIVTRAKEFLNAWLDHMAISYDWEMLLTEAGVTSAGHIVSLAGVTDYRSVASLKLDGITAPLQQASYRELWPLIKQALEDGATGTPAYFTPTPDRSQILLYPVPSANQSGDLLYYKRPEQELEDDDYPWFEDVLTLINGVAHYAQVYDKEQLSVIIAQLSAAAFGQYRAAHEDKGRNTPQTFKWGSSFVPMKRQ